jgi:hypothetical protein
VISSEFAHFLFSRSSWIGCTTCGVRRTIAVFKMCFPGVRAMD